MLSKQNMYFCHYFFSSNHIQHGLRDIMAKHHLHGRILTSKKKDSIFMYHQETNKNDLQHTQALL